MPEHTGERPGPTRDGWLLLGLLAVLAAVCAAFYLRQNAGGQIGGRMSLPKILWLGYALAAWFLLPLYFWRSPRLPAALRRVYGWHLASFGTRGVLELWLLYGVHAWIPPYGIGHDVFHILLLTGLAARTPGKETHPEAAGARRFLTSIRLALVAEILFAGLFFLVVRDAVRGPEGIWFASDEPIFRWINGLTWTAVLIGLADLLRTLRPVFSGAGAARGA